MGNVKDPWRVEAPQNPTPTKIARKTGKINIYDIDLDEDLRVPGVYAFESRYGSIEVKDVRVASPSAALDLLASCIVMLDKEGYRMPEGVDVWFGSPEKNIKTGACLCTAPDYPYPAGINFIDVVYDSGMVDLIRWLNVARKTKGKVFRQFGVSTRLR